MAKELDLKSCLLWEAERPSNGSPQRSSYFRSFGEDWRLTLNYTGSDIYVDISSPNGLKMFDKGVSTTCHVIIGSRVFDNTGHYYGNSGTILKCSMSSQDVRLTPLRWIIYCRIHSFKPLSLQINDETKFISYEPLLATSNQNVQACAKIPPDLQSLSDDFSRLLNEEINPDATLTCGGRIWKVHRTVLIARSEVFAGMFRSGMIESETSTVKVEDLEATVLDSLLKYIYSGTVSDQNVPALYQAANKYAVLRLRKTCSDRMAKTLSPKNCLDYLAVADAHSDAQLKEVAISFAIKHIAEIEKAIWAEFRNEHPFLAIEVLEHCVPTMKE